MVLVVVVEAVVVAVIIEGVVVVAIVGVELAKLLEEVVVVLVVAVPWLYTSGAPNTSMNSFDGFTLFVVVWC